MNPYSFLNPVTESNMFYGYQPELERIVQKVTDRRPTSFFVIGGRSMGKTSLLRQVEQRLRLFGMENLASSGQQLLVIPIYLDMLQLGEITLNDFYGKIARLMSQALAAASSSLAISEQVNTLLQSVKSATEPFDTLVDALDELIQTLQHSRLRVTLLIDDLWRVKHQDIEGIIVRNLRALLIHPPLDKVVACVITGSYSEYDSVITANSPLENLLILVDLHAFNEEQSLTLINESTESKIPPEVAQQVYIETGGHPLLLQYVMSELCDYEDWSALTAEDVYQATERFNRERKDFHRWWEKLGEADRKIYAVFLREERASVDDLVRMMLSIPTEGSRNRIIDRPMIEDSLRVLATMGLLREYSDGMYALAGQWPARWFSLMHRTTMSLS